MVEAPTTAPAKVRPLLRIDGLSKSYAVQRGFLRRTVGQTHAVDDVSLDLWPGETLGLVGESGCGKSTIAKTIMRATDPTDGSIEYDDGSRSAPVDIARAGRAQMRSLRRDIQLVFQDPYSSLSPRQRVRDIIGEPLLVNGLAKGRALEERVEELMEAVGLRKEHAVRYPHAFSGGQRQRVGIARALALDPKLIVCDEPVSALDMSIQAQILNLLKDLQERFSLTYLFISHDLGVVQHVSDRVAVMYLGRIVEVAPARSLFTRPRHPYTEALMLAAPKPHPRYRGQMRVLSGELPSGPEARAGCAFRSRCPHAQSICSTERPPLVDAPETTGHRVACHFASELQLRGVGAPDGAG